MKVVELVAFGGPEQLQLVERPVPSVGTGEVRIRVEAVGVNFSDILMRLDRYAATPALPAVLGSEIAGIVEEIGPDVVDLAVGDRVVAALFATGNSMGGYAEQVVTSEQWVAPVPASVSLEQAAAALVTGLTARYLLDRSPVRGKTLLVTAAAGGVGSMLLQMARADGAHKVVAAAGGPDKCAFALSMGAHDVVDYLREDWADRLRDSMDGALFDIIFESTGGDVMRGAFNLLGNSAQMLIYGALNLHDFNLGVPQLGQMIFRNQSITGFALAPLLSPASFRHAVGRVLDMVGTGEVKVAIGARHPLAQAAQAHRAIEGRQSTGKTVLLP